MVIVGNSMRLSTRCKKPVVGNNKTTCTNSEERLSLDDGIREGGSLLCRRCVHFDSHVLDSDTSEHAFVSAIVCYSGHQVVRKYLRAIVFRCRVTHSSMSA
jgi:hypothetical protein